MIHPSRISVELVPRSRSHLRAELAAVQAHLRTVDTVNIPDLIRFSTRSWDACALAGSFRSIPHIRAIDLDPHAPLPMAETLDEHGIQEVLIVSGDPPTEMSRRTFHVDAERAIRRFRQELPHIQVYAGLDPYRQSFAAERDYIERKLEAGAVGFFTQPFFDMRLLEMYAELIPEGVQIWWGATTVTEEGSFNYWQTRNKAIFPRSFELTLECNRKFATDLLEFVRSRGDHAYFMPVRESAVEYLQGLL